MVVERAGEVIPQVVSSIVSKRTGDETAFEMPETCPSCAEPVVRAEGEAAHLCVNAACPAQLVRLLEHFVSKGAMDIEGLGIKQTTVLLEKGLIQQVADLYSLKQGKPPCSLNASAKRASRTCFPPSKPRSRARSPVSSSPSGFST